jgi:hypothetical protein
MNINKQRIESLAKQAAKDELVDEIAQLLKECGYYSIVCQNQEFKGLYRARKHNGIEGNIGDSGKTTPFLTVKEFWNPPKEYVKQNGRCNYIEESVFYGSNEFETALAEVRPDLNHYISIAAFEPISRENSPKFNTKPVCIQHLKKITSIKSCWEAFQFEENNEVLRELDNYLDELFTEIVDEDSQHHYFITNAIVKCMMSDMRESDGKNSPIHAMIYPSILRDLKSINVLFPKPDHFRAKYYCKHIQTFQVLEISKNGALIKLVRHGIPSNIGDFIEKDYQIGWQEIENGEEALINLQSS